MVTILMIVYMMLLADFLLDVLLRRNYRTYRTQEGIVVTRGPSSTRIDYPKDYNPGPMPELFVNAKDMKDDSGQT